jgi:DNA-binding NarL/FixJ family response regulator
VTVRVLIADRQQLLRAAFRVLIDSSDDMVVVGDVGPCDALGEAIERCDPQVVLVGPGACGEDELEAISDLIATHADVHVLLLTVEEQGALLSRALQSGATGYVPTRASRSELLDAIRAVARGDVYVHPAVTRNMMALLRPDLLTDADVSQPLTPEELETLRGVAQGYTNEQIADAMDVSIRTIERRRAGLRHKLNLDDRADFVRYAREHGLGA